MGYRYALFQINATHCDACFGTVNLVVSVDSVWSTITPALAIFFSLLVQFDELLCLFIFKYFSSWYISISDMYYTFSENWMITF